MRHAYAAARLSLLAVIELGAFLVCFGPLLHADAPWKLDCLFIGFASLGGAFLLFGIAFAVRLGYPWRESNRDRLASLLEFAIIVLYSWNTFCLAVAIVRTGGPTTSQYAPLIAIQMTVMLLLEAQRQEATNAKSIHAVLYVVIALVTWGILEYAYAHHLAFAFNRDPVGFDLRSAQSTGTFWLAALGMIFSYLGYDLPRRAFFKTWLTKFDNAI
jgi:hypothetical protein